MQLMLFSDFLVYVVVAVSYAVFSLYQVLGQYKWPESLDSDFVYGECILSYLEQS